LTIELTFAVSRPRADVDAYFKATCDSLVLCGVLRDDRYEDLELAPVVFHRGERPHTRLILEDL
jgi:hypothetical protein